MQQPDPARDRPGVGRPLTPRIRAAAAPVAVVLLVRAHQERDVPRVDGLVRAELARGAAPQLGDEAAQLVDDEVLADLLVVDTEHRQEVLLVAEVAEGPVAEVVQQAGQAQRLLDDRRATGVPGSTSASVGYTCRASSPARCMAPRLWANRLCSAVGNTHQELCSWWMRLRRWTHGLSMTSASAISPARDSVMRR